MDPIAILITVYKALLWILWSIVLPIAFIIALRQWRRFNEERCDKEHLERVKLAIRLAEVGIETDFNADISIMNDKERHASCLQRLIFENQMCYGRLEKIRSSQKPDEEKPPVV